METNDLDMVREWRNDINVRRYMYTQHEIGAEEHRRWFSRAIAAPGVHLLILEQDGMDCGFVNITQIRQGPIADWSFHLAPNVAKGTGKQLGLAALDYAFVNEGLHKVCGEALEYNERSVRHHLRLGFVQEGKLRDQYFDNAKFYDVLRFGILAEEWFGIRAEIAAKLTAVKPTA
jgi:UDP-4-amino-4,6-dideoxy-N-acetyl-beta-L-altrosamine N-acetyltransferase